MSGSEGPTGDGTPCKECGHRYYHAAGCPNTPRRAHAKYGPQAAPDSTSGDNGLKDVYGDILADRKVPAEVKPKPERDAKPVLPAPEPSRWESAAGAVIMVGGMIAMGVLMAALFGDSRGSSRPTLPYREIDMWCPTRCWP